jgi:predicted protein tyrosine phosphatase
MAETMPVLSYDDAQAVGEAFHDHWAKMAGSAPIERGDLAWADMVQFVARTARERIAARAESER